MLVAGLTYGQEPHKTRSYEWNQEKERAWDILRAEFPEYTSTEWALKETYAWIQQWDAWAKVNDPELYDNPLKPLFYARRKKAAEIESATKAARLSAETEERRKALAQQAANPHLTEIAKQLLSNKSLEELFKDDPELSGTIRRYNSPQDSRQANWVGSTIILIVTFGLAWGLHRIIHPRNGAISAITLGRKWAAWMVAVATISLLPSFLQKLDGSSLALWVLVVVLVGLPAFLIGWIIGLFKFRDRNGADPSSPARLPEAFRADAANNSVEKMPAVPTPNKSTPQDGKNNSQKLPLIVDNIRFEVEIPEGERLKNGYVEMRHNTQYSLILINHPWVPCDAEVAIDGIHVGTWRIESRGVIHIERPVDDTGHFTFFQVGTAEADMAGITKHPENGLISVTFKPMKDRSGLNAGLRAGPLQGAELGAGATGLTGESQQRFRDAPEIEHDMERAFTIHLRLVSRKQDIRPLASRSTPIPPPVA